MSSVGAALTTRVLKYLFGACSTETIALCGTRCVIIDREYFPKSKANASKYLNYTKRKQSVRYLFSKPRRSLYRLRLKFVQTTRVVCTDYSWSLQKVLRTYKFKYTVLVKVSACTHWNKCAYLHQWVRRTYFGGCIVSLMCPPITEHYQNHYLCYIVI